MVRSRRWRWLVVATLLAVVTLFFSPSQPSAEAQGPSGATSPIKIVPIEPAREVKGGTASTLVTPNSLGDFVPDATAYTPEIEPNNLFTQSTSITLPAIVKGNIFPNGDFDWFSFTATAGDTFFASVMTSFSANASTDSQLRLFASDGTTEIEFDDDNGTLGSVSSVIAGATIPATGTYYIRVNHFSATNQLRPYILYVVLENVSPTPETEPNDTNVTANPLPGSGYVSGSITTATDADWFSFSAGAGDTMAVMLDADPERDGTDTSVRLGIGVFNNNILVVDDQTAAAEPNAEAMYMTFGTAGTYYVYVDRGTATQVVGNYRFSATLYPAQTGQICTTYTSGTLNTPIPDQSAGGVLTSTITVADSFRIADVNVSININHANPPDLDVSLVSPQNNYNGLITDVGVSTQPTMTIRLDDEAAFPAGLFTVYGGQVVQPELAYRLNWYDGELSNGTWQLVLNDDANNNVGTLQSWSVELCQEVATTCPVGTTAVLVYGSDFEANDGGFTHNGTQDEWERGLPTAAPINTCNSGSSCWKTDLDSTYNAFSNQNLLSPVIDLSDPDYVSAYVQWAQRYQMENATFDQHSVRAFNAGPTNSTTLFEWFDATMTNLVGNPTVTRNASAGWGLFTGSLNSYVGDNDLQLQWNVTTDNTVELGGVAVDDVAVYACETLPTPTPTNTATNTPVPPTNTPTNTATNTPVPPTNTATNTPVPPTNTPTNTATNTPVPPTNTPTNTATNTPVPPTATATATTPGGSQVVTYCSTFTPVTIPDNLPAAGVTATLSIPAAAQILDANVRISTTHTWVGDLTFRLTNGATPAVIVNRPGFPAAGSGCSSNNIDDNYVDDEGADGTWESSCSNVTGQTPAYPAGTRMLGGDPASATLLNVYDGGSTAGTWSLYVTDSAAQDTGTLNQFCMEFLVPAGATATPTSTSVPPTNTATNTAVPPTNTATATGVPPTNTATATGVPPTNTATATPGSGGRVCSSTVVAIPDSNPTGVTSVINVGTAGTISDLNVVISGTHTWVGDLIFNISNGSTNVTFYDRPGVPASTFGCTGDNILGSVADDEGTNGSWENSCTASTPAFIPGGTYTNNTALTAFDGAAAAGNWTLTVSDNAGGDTGTLDGWCVDITTGAGPTPTATATAGQVPDINVNPGSFTETHSSAPQVTTDTMNIQNVGSGSLTWTITEDDSRPWNAPNPAQPRDPNASVERLSGSANGKVSPLVLGPIVGDGSFETGTPNASWEEFSSNFGTPLCDAVCGTGGGTGPRTGAWWAWFGGTTAAETGIVTQTVTIPSGSAELTFWLEIPPTATGTNGFLSVRMDGTEVFRAEETTAGYSTYAEVSVDASAYADGGSHELVFFSTTDAGAAVTNFFVDDVAITATAGGQCTAPTDIPWLTVSPTNGSTSGGGSTPVTLTYNSASLATGTYTGTLCVASNDPDEALVTVPITLNVEPPTAIDLSSFTSPVAGVNLGDLAAAGLLLLAGAVLILRRK